MKPKQLEAIELLIEGELNNTEIAEKLGINRRTLNNWKKDDKFKEAFNDALTENMRYYAVESYNTIKNLHHAKSEFVRLQSANSILDRIEAKDSIRFNSNTEFNSIDDVKNYLSDLLSNSDKLSEKTLKNKLSIADKIINCFKIESDAEIQNLEEMMKDILENRNDN